MLAHITLRGATTPPPVRTCLRFKALGLSLRLRVSHLPGSSSPGAVRVSTDTPQYVGTVPLLIWPMEA